MVGENTRIQSQRQRTLEQAACEPKQMPHSLTPMFSTDDAKCPSGCLQRQTCCYNLGDWTRIMFKATSFPFGQAANQRVYQSCLPEVTGRKKKHIMPRNSQGRILNFQNSFMSFPSHFFWSLPGRKPRGDQAILGCPHLVTKLSSKNQDEVW